MVVCNCYWCACEGGVSYESYEDESKMQMWNSMDL
jgi:hypothetical protein